MKLENIVLDSNFDLKVCDFGLGAQYKPGEKLKSLVGTDKYMSPQIVKMQAYDPEKNDVFACGVILFSLLYGFPPYFKSASA